MEKAIILTCSRCGHRERESANRELMAKVRMYNHVAKEHPAVAERFNEVVAVESPRTRVAVKSR